MFNINKKPEHPGAIARLLLLKEGYNLVDTNEFNENKIKVMQRGIGGECTVARFELSFILELKESRCDYCIAYELVKLLPHTTMEFWLNKQDEYDAWHEWHKQNDAPVMQEYDGEKPEKKSDRENLLKKAQDVYLEEVYGKIDCRLMGKCLNSNPPCADCAPLQGKGFYSLINEKIKEGFDAGEIGWRCHKDGTIEIESSRCRISNCYCNKCSQKVIKND